MVMPSDNIGDPEFSPVGHVDANGIPVQAHDLTPDQVVSRETSMFPVLGVIRKVYFADSFNNMSRLNRENSDTDTFTSMQDIQNNLKKVTENAYRFPGHQLMCHVEVRLGGRSVKNIPDVPICPGLGGVSDYAMVVPKGVTNSPIPDNGLGDGYQCLVGFIGGNVQWPFVFSYWPNPLNSDKVPKISDGHVAFFMYNNFRLKIDKGSNLIVDGRLAGNKTKVNSDTGQIQSPLGNQFAGKISLVTKSDINLIAGCPQSGSEADLPAGRGIFKATKSLHLLSSQSTVDVFTKDSSNLVNLQSAHGGARRAAREGDSVEVVAGSGTDIFSYINLLRSTLQIVGNILSDSSLTSDPGALAAGAVIKAFASQEVPNLATGKITSGSDYVKIGWSVYWR